jgi:protein TonB
MPKPLVSNDPKPRDVQFSHFGVLDEGQRSKGAAATSLVVNFSLILFLIVVSAIVKTNPQLAAKITPLYNAPPKPIPPAPKPPPPPPPKPLPEVPKIKVEPPKINIPKPVETPPEIKPLPAPVPKPVQLAAPAPKAVTAAPAPKVVNLAAAAHPASIANNDAHPSAVRLGNPEIRALNGPPVATPVNLGGGMHGMPASNTGSGPVGKVNFGNGSPSGTNMGRSAGVVAVTGLSHGTPGGTGTGVSGPKSVGLGSTAVAAAAAPSAPRAATLAKSPVITSVPRADRTPDAIASKISGDVRVNVVLRANGTVTVGSVVSGPGHGLNEVARQVAGGIRFKPAMDSSGQPVDFPTVVTIHFLTND